ncbi:nucleotidyltransferase family protein [Terribacillus sp. DMT04]|uniref:nucleotidyltransferase family protein n=1 Tax=Terribacillus sp. DMT04 TaxID=2850441 RepID=UPI001C2BEA9F|nr:nucleotidyltransferase family protein [Terribacillus sp. DMT04]QXE00952.1 nucleotidyltransferase family protein [Terribacillus sp. DMT04]
MKNWGRLVVTASTSIFETMKIIDQNSSQFAIVTDEKLKLLGTITDGDIRRGILKGLSLEESTSKIMNRNPITITQEHRRSAIRKLFKENSVRYIPVLNKFEQVTDLYVSDAYTNQSVLSNKVVIMAGGLGTRLRPLTESIPKPMLTVGNKPILQTILESFIDYGFRQFYYSVNYKKELIKSHFGDGTNWGVAIDYLEENQKLGTAGALSLVNKRPAEPFFVMNGDILTKVNYQQLLDFHNENNSVATMCVREIQYNIPYGVVKTEGTALRSIVEKPTESYFVNAGIYLINPEVLDLIPNGAYLDMPSLFEELMERQLPTSVFPIREYWMDIGRMNDFERANSEYMGVFG